MSDTPGENVHPTYSVHPAVLHGQAMVRDLAAKTGRALEEWTELLDKEGLADEKQRWRWLRGEHGLGGATSSLIAELSLGKGAEKVDPEAYLAAAPAWVDALYSGPKAGLRPIHDTLVELALALGSDVRVCPATTIVPLYRRHVFAEIKPATAKRIDLGLSLRNSTQDVPYRLIETEGLDRGDRITHRFEITTPHDIDGQVREWLRIAYATDL